jgi:hypothetical protein
LNHNSRDFFLYFVDFFAVGNFKSLAECYATLGAAFS